MTKSSHHLRAHRRRAGLGQADLAILLGDRTHSRVSRYERGRRLPPLEVALAYQTIFGARIEELFADVLRRVKSYLRQRAARLSMQREPRNRVLAARRKRSLENIRMQ